MKIGIIFTAFNCTDTVEQCLNTWIGVKNSIPNIEFIYSCVSVPFKDFPAQEDDGTIEYIQKSKIMDVHFTEPRDCTEIEARGLCLQYLKAQEIDIVWIVDLDEEYTVGQIQKTIEYINNSPDYFWFSINFKNLFDTPNQYIDGFCPPRIYRVNSPPYILGGFIQDNDITYVSGLKFEVDCNYLRHKEIPKEIAHIKHYSWLSNKRSRDKHRYQLLRWGACSYKWNDIENKIEIDQDYYTKRNLPIPEILVDL